jgi:hypothetical protein
MTITNKKTAFNWLFSFTGDQKTSTVEIARGRDAHFKKGMRLPFSEVHRSESEAIHGSVIASKSRPKAVMPPITVKIPKTTSPWGINIVCPWAIDASSG